MDRPPTFLWVRAERRQFNVFVRHPDDRIRGAEDGRITLASGYLAQPDSHALDDLRVKSGLPWSINASETRPHRGDTAN
jgi:hypothetical protein